jgi:hypothetical protein
MVPNDVKQKKQERFETDFEKQEQNCFHSIKICEILVIHC